MYHHHEEAHNNGLSLNAALRYLLRSNRLRDSLRLIGILLFCVAMSFMLVPAKMIITHFDGRFVSSSLFLESILLLMSSIVALTRNIVIANSALDVHLSNLEMQQEWEKYCRL